MKNIRIIIADDHPLVIEGVSRLLADTEDLQVIQTFLNAESLMEALPMDPMPDVMLLDLDFGGADGAKICRKLSQKYPQLGILILTSYEDTALVKNLLSKGAKGYLFKNADSEEIKQAIREIAAGGTYLQSAVKEALVAESLNQPAKRSFRPRITRREKEVLRLIIEEKTSPEIAEILHVSLNTVETHRMHLFQKLGVRNVAGLVREALEKGIVGLNSRAAIYRG